MSNEITVDRITARIGRTTDDTTWSLVIPKAPFYPVVAFGTGVTPTRDYLVDKLKEYIQEVQLINYNFFLGLVG